jgi:hypothetical protein
MTEVKLVDEMINGCPEVVIGLPDDQGPGGIEGFDDSDTKSIFQTTMATLDRDGPKLVVQPKMKVIFESSVMVECPFYSGDRSIQSNTHGPTLPSPIITYLTYYGVDQPVIVGRHTVAIWGQPLRRRGATKHPCPDD